MSPLDAKTRNAAIARLAGWKKVPKRQAIEKEFRFKDFASAFAWMSQVARQAEEMDHHPEWHNVYNRVHVVLTTHDAKGITPLDIVMAQFMNKCSRGAI